MPKIYIIGTGPGAIEYMCGKALEAIRVSEVVVGYKTYIDLIIHLLEGKEVVSSGMRKEVERCAQVIEIASTGKTVCLVSSGDPGVYGMAGILLEMLAATNKHIDVEVVPGITSALSSASLVGAPLMNDFALISLSDLMTPWEIIEKRIDRAADGDFVISIYNPKSKGRVTHLERCMQIIGKYRDIKTPVAIVKDAMRQEMSTIITTLGDVVNHEVDMTTTLIVGNSQTYTMNNKMITPRGYKLG